MYNKEYICNKPDGSQMLTIIQTFKEGEYLLKPNKGSQLSHFVQSRVKVVRRGSFIPKRLV